MKSPILSVRAFLAQQRGMAQSLASLHAAQAQIIQSVTDLHERQQSIIDAQASIMDSQVAGLQETALCSQAVMGVQQAILDVQAALEIIVSGGQDAPATPASTAAQVAAAALPPASPCAVKGCGEPATLAVTVKGHGSNIPVCDGHAQMLAKQAFTQAPAKKEKVLCEEGYDHSDEPDYVPGQIHAHVQVPTREEFLASEGVADSDPDADVLKPPPLDDISAAIEAAYQARKADIAKAVGKP